MPYNKPFFGNGARLLKDVVVEPGVEKQLVAVHLLYIANTAVEKSLNFLVLLKRAKGIGVAFQLIETALGQVIEGWAYRIGNSRIGRLEFLESLGGGLRLGVVIKFLTATTAVGSLSRLGKTSDVSANSLRPTTPTASAAKGRGVCRWWLAHDAMWCVSISVGERRRKEECVLCVY